MKDILELHVVLYITFETSIYNTPFLLLICKAVVISSKKSFDVYFLVRCVISILRPIKGIKGLTREVIVALTTNIESQEFRRRYGQHKGLPPEHPRAGSTDDVEAIFAFLHELLGKTFDEKAFHEAFPKVMLEFTKKCDPNLPFYHYTGVNERYNAGLLPCFNVPSASGVERLDRVVISRRADPGVFVANRAVMPQRGKLTIRSAHFRPAEGLPPPPQ
jgi:hypothetical protein